MRISFAWLLALWVALFSLAWARDVGEPRIVRVIFHCNPENAVVEALNEELQWERLGTADRAIAFNSMKYDNFRFSAEGYEPREEVIQSRNFHRGAYPLGGKIELVPTLLTRAKRAALYLLGFTLLAAPLVAFVRRLKQEKNLAQERLAELQELQAEAMITKDTVLGQRLGNYLLTAFLGKGGMAVVYKATDGPAPRTGNVVAVKVLSALEDEQTVERFRREVQICRKLIHPNIVALHDWGEEAGLIYLALELVEGGSLEDWMKRELSLEESLRIFDEILAGMEFAHQQGVTHRDLKPDNILMTTSGKPKVADFGLAKSLAIKTVTVTGAVMGTPGYMSPDQIQGHDPSPSMDQYSLGVMGFQLFTGRLPFEAQDMMALITKHLLEPVPSPLSVRPDLPPELSIILQRMLAKEPLERFADLTAVRSALRPLLSSV